jgi:hypothetical protein
VVKPFVVFHAARLSRPPNPQVKPPKIPTICVTTRITASVMNAAAPSLRVDDDSSARARSSAAFWLDMSSAGTASAVANGLPASALWLMPIASRVCSALRLLQRIQVDVTAMIERLVIIELDLAA